MDRYSNIPIVKVSFATLSDAEPLADVYIQAEKYNCTYPTWPENIALTHKQKAQDLGFKLQDPDKRKQTIVLSRHEQPIGYLQYTTMPRGCYFVDDFYIAEPGKGLGKRLFGFFVKTLKEATEIRLMSSVFANDFYKKCGFIEDMHEMVLHKDRIVTWQQHQGLGYPEFAKKRHY